MARIGGVNFGNPVLIQQQLMRSFNLRNRQISEEAASTSSPHIQKQATIRVEPAPPVRQAPITPGFVRPEFDT